MELVLQFHGSKSICISYFHLPRSWSVKWSDLKLHSCMNQMTMNLSPLINQHSYTTLCMPNHISVRFGVYRHDPQGARSNCKFFTTHQMIKSTCWPLFIWLQLFKHRCTTLTIFKSCGYKCWLMNDDDNIIHSMYNIKTVSLVITIGL
jgi:hypothetical protein